MTSYLLDTNVINELFRPNPAAQVLGWLDMLSTASRVYTSSIVVSEIAFGIERLPQGRKRITLQKWFDDLLSTTFKDRVLPFGTPDGICYGRFAALLGHKQPHALQVQDVQIAAVAACHGLVVATRNLRDFEGIGVPLLSPWDLAP